MDEAVKSVCDILRRDKGKGERLYPDFQGCIGYISQETANCT